VIYIPKDDFETDFHLDSWNNELDQVIEEPKPKTLSSAFFDPLDVDNIIETDPLIKKIINLPDDSHQKGNLPTLEEVLAKKN